MLFDSPTGYPKSLLAIVTCHINRPTVSPWGCSFLEPPKVFFGQAVVDTSFLIADVLTTRPGRGRNGGGDRALLAEGE